MSYDTFSLEVVTPRLENIGNKFSTLIRTFAQSVLTQRAEHSRFTSHDTVPSMFTHTNFSQDSHVESFETLVHLPATSASRLQLRTFFFADFKDSHDCNVTPD